MAGSRSLCILWLIFTCLTEIDGLSCTSNAVNMCSKYSSLRAPQVSQYQVYMTATQVANVQSCTCKLYSVKTLNTVLESSAAAAGCSSTLTARDASGVVTLATISNCASSTSISGVNLKMTLTNGGGGVGDEYCFVVTVPSYATLYILCDSPQVSSTTVNNCQSNSCNYNGVCTSNSDGTVTCACTTGYTGSSCETNIDYCTSTTCGDHGTCIERTDGFECRCNLGYTGITCGTFIGFCGNNPCVQGTCVNKEDDYYCDCDPGYSDKNCSTSAFACDAAPCQNGGTCADTITGGYICKCNTGYSGTNCETEDAPSCSATTCSNGGTCIDRLDGGYTCICVNGYRGTTCDVVDTACSPTTCSNGGTCVDELTGGYICVCTNDYTGSVCQTYNSPCTSYPCRNGGTCVDKLTGGFRCECAGGFMGTQCETVDTACSPTTCSNGGTCIDELTGGFICDCVGGFIGTQCETDNRDCSSSPCSNGGTCEDILGGGFKCVCDATYTGTQCEYTLGCTSNPCQKNSRCTDGSAGTYTCTCIENFTGTICDEGLFFEQWASIIISTSSIYDGCYTDRQILGPPDVYPIYGDYYESWCPEDYSSTDDYVFVGYDRALVTKLSIYETNYAGAIFEIFLSDADTGALVSVYQNTPFVLQQANILEVDVSVPMISDGVKIHVNSAVSNSYVELDAVKIEGYHG